MGLSIDIGDKWWLRKSGVDVTTITEVQFEERGKHRREVGELQDRVRLAQDHLDYLVLRKEIKDDFVKDKSGYDLYVESANQIGVQIISFDEWLEKR